MIIRRYKRFSNIALKVFRRRGLRYEGAAWATLSDVFEFVGTDRKSGEPVYTYFTGQEFFNNRGSVAALRKVVASRLDIALIGRERQNA